jgi:hypothetical protein
VDVDRGDGTVVPGGIVPVSVAFNILTPEPTEVSLRCSAELRPIEGGEPVWRADDQAVVATNTLDAPKRMWNVLVPRVEGTYVLEVRSTWEPLAGVEGRLGRWFRRRRNPTSSSAVRRVSLAVVGPKAHPGPPGGADVEQTVEVIDLARLRGQRPSASGRAPLVAMESGDWPVPEAALVEATRRDRLRGWIMRAGSETAVLAPADATGLAWSALGLKVPHPGRPHRLSLTITAGHPSALGVALIDTGGPGRRPRLLLDACASGPPVLDGMGGSTFSWLVWPDASDPSLVLVNRDDAAPVQLGTVTLTELGDVPAAPAIVEPRGDNRGLALDLPEPAMLQRFGGGEPGSGDGLALARNLVGYMTYCGASGVVVPEDIGDRQKRRALDGQAAEDATGPDRLEMVLRLLARQGYAAWLELAFEGTLPGLPAPNSAEAHKRGLVRVDRRGAADGPAYHPLNPEVQTALRRRVTEVATARKVWGNLAGLLIRLGPGPTLLGAADSGLDDVTYARFVREAFGPETTATVPGLGTTDARRFTARSQFVAGPGRMPWLTWRSRGIATLYGDLAEAVRSAAPGATLAVATPVLDDGPAGHEARRVDLAGLPSSHAWRAVGLDLEAWPAGDAAPLVLRGVGLSTDELAHDLATSPELDAQVVTRSARGLLIRTDEAARREPADAAFAGGFAGASHRPGGDSGLRLSALPLADGGAADELMGHAVAALDARWVMLSAGAVLGHEESLRQFARVFRALPYTSTAAAPIDRQAFGVAVRTARSGDRTYLSLANDTPYPIRLETILGTAGPATVDDLGRGLRLAPEVVAGRGSRLVLDLPSFGVAAIRVGARDVDVGPVVPYPSEAVLAGMQARYDELSSQLSKLNQAPGRGLGPANPGFEPATPPQVQLTAARLPLTPTGWQLAGGMGSTVELDPKRPHSGRGSLRLHAPAPPAAVISDGFAAKGLPGLTIQAWLRGDDAEAKVRIWIEGEAAGQPFLRWSELTVPAEWTAKAIRAADFPAGGLDRVRLRFELLSAGSLWVDDVSVTGSVLSEPELSNARRVVIAALRAYREKRYADFARLAGSHWARTPGVSPDGPAERDAAGHAEANRSGKATALPSNRMLR